MFIIAASVAYKMVNKIYIESKLDLKKLGEIYVDLLFKVIEKVFTSNGILTTFGSLLPEGQFFHLGTDIILKYYIKYILYTQKYFELEFMEYII